MKVLNFGSLNIDHVYQLDQFVRPGETVACLSYNRFCGGKGLNQSVALAHGEATVFHGGMIGEDGHYLKDFLDTHGVHTEYVRAVETASGHAIIQVNSDGENGIVISGGANQAISSEIIDTTLNRFSKGDWLLLQNEISRVAEIINKAHMRGLHIAFNPAPCSPEVHDYPLEKVDLLIVNETEAIELTAETDADLLLEKLQSCYPQSAILYTRGSQGAVYLTGEERHFIQAPRVNAVDTTAAGDTFIGFFLSSLIRCGDIQKSLTTAAAAAAISVTRTGAASSIPTLAEVEKFQMENIQ